MRRSAYLTTGLAIQALSNMIKAEIFIHGQENIPKGSVIFVINHFTRVETLLLPYHIFHLNHVPVWSLADYTLFTGSLGRFLENVGAVSTKDPHRDSLIVKSLLTGEANWIIFPEGRMVKSKKIFEKGKYMIYSAGGKHPPHTGAATLALRTEFYRQRLKKLSQHSSDEANRLLELFNIDSIDKVLRRNTFIVPVNITYYPIRAKENMISRLAKKMKEDLSERAVEELLAEGTILFSDTDVDIRFGKPIDIRPFLNTFQIGQDIGSPARIDFDDPLASKQDMRVAAVEIMEEYMSDIYHMTTINHDHLFASILRLYPLRKMRIDDLKRRAYLAATTCIDKKRVYIHKSLETDQTHLLTDDHFLKCHDFISVALEKGNLKRKGKFLVKDRTVITNPFDYLRIRRDNPIEVIANEVEPMTTLLRKIRTISWQPPFWLRHKIAKYRLYQDLREFDQDYARYYIEKESKPKKIGRPFLVKGNSKKIGIVLIHGYMAAPYEVRELALYLGKKGFWVYVPRLKGHGTSPEDLARVSYKDWVFSAEKGYALMANICRKVVMGGFSTGAGLALEMAYRIRRVVGVFAISPPMRLQDFSSKFAPAVDVWNRLMNLVKLDSAKREFVENHPENPHINYFRNPISGVKELERLMLVVENRLPNIKVPALVMQGSRDPVVSDKGSKLLFEKLGSEHKEYVLLNFDRHGILLGKGSDKVHQTVYEYLVRLKSNLK